MSFTYKIKGCAQTPFLHYEIGSCDEQGQWHRHIISGSVFETFDAANDAAIKMVEKATDVYRKKWLLRLARKLA